MYIGFKTIFKEEKALYLNEANKNEFVYLKLSNGRREIFSDSELITINNHFKKLYEQDLSETKLSPLDYSIRDKLDYIINKTSEDQKKIKWKDLLSKYSIYFSDTDKELSEIEKFKENIIDNDIPDRLRNKEVSKLLKELFNYCFKGEIQFLEYTSSIIDYFDRTENLSVELEDGTIKNWNLQSLFTEHFKGSKDHPWLRLWNTYEQNSEIHLYNSKKSFTKIMNKIELQFFEFVRSKESV